MRDLEDKLDYIKSKFIAKDLKYLTKLKLKNIPNNIKDDNLLNEYEYYIKLNKKLKKYTKDNNINVIQTIYDKNNFIVMILTKFDIKKLEIGIPIKIILLTGYNKDTYMNCTYYSYFDEGILYIDEFVSGIRKKGLGSILLKNIDYIAEKLNEQILKNNNLSLDYKLNSINIIRGRSVPSISIITQEELNKIYTKNGFTVCDENYFFKLKE